jgi:hypothetical protein
MPMVPAPDRVFKNDDDVCPTTPHGPGRDWPQTYEMTHGVGSLSDVTPFDPDVEFLAYDEPKHLHPGPLGFVAVDTRTREERSRPKRMRQMRKV